MGLSLTWMIFSLLTSKSFTGKAFIDFGIKSINLDFVLNWLGFLRIAEFAIPTVQRSYRLVSYSVVKIILYPS